MIQKWYYLPRKSIKIWAKYWKWSILNQNCSPRQAIFFRSVELHAAKCDQKNVYFCSLFICSQIVHLFRQLDTMNKFFYWWFLSRVLIPPPPFFSAIVLSLSSLSICSQLSTIHSFYIALQLSNRTYICTAKRSFLYQSYSRAFVFLLHLLNIMGPAKISKSILHFHIDS